MQRIIHLALALMLIAAIMAVDMNEKNIRATEPEATMVITTLPLVPIYPISYSDRSFACLSEAIYQEAGVESDQGKEAVGIVILNRTVQRHTQDVCGVIREYRMVEGVKVCQFSYKCSDKLPPKQGKNWNDSSFIAMNLLHNRFEHGAWAIVAYADHYHASYVHPTWADKFTLMGQIGNHLFYRA
jgi:spore germination cell wall hydrolase CwlJ-like protein